MGSIIIVNTSLLCRFTVDSSNEIFEGLQLSLGKTIEIPNHLFMSSTSSEVIEEFISQINKASNRIGSQGREPLLSCFKQYGWRSLTVHGIRVSRDQYCIFKCINMALGISSTII